MGSLADLIIATIEDVPDIAASDYPLGTYKGTNVDGLDPLMLMALHSLLTGTVIEDLVSEFQPIAQASDEGPWLVRIPPELLGILSNVAPHEMEALAEKWAQTDQLRSSGWSTEDTEGFLDPLILHAQSLTGSGKDLYLWTYG